MIVYVAGYGRSGSTLLDRLLSLFPDVQGFGELAFLPDMLLAGGTVNCSCGQTVQSCEFWQGVLTEVGPSLTPSGGPDAVVRLVRRFEGAGALWLPLWRWRGGSVSRYRDLMRAILGAIRHRLPPGAILVDSSKTARLASGRALALAKVSGEEVRVIHLVRDGRAVLWSALRGDNRLLERGINKTPPGVALRTLVGSGHANLAALLLRWRLGKGRSLLVEYERLVTAPDAELARIADFIGVPRSDDWRSAVEQVNHRFAGNRNRHARQLVLTLDDEWRGRLGAWHRVLWALFSWPVERLVRASGGGHR